MTQEQDEREFEELWNLTDEEEFSHNSYEYRVGKHYWLASRRSLRDKEGMDEKVKEIEEIKDWVNKSMTAEMGDDYYVTITHDDWHRITNYFPKLLSHIRELQVDMILHFQKEHLEGDGPEIDRWKRMMKELEESLNFWKKDAGLEQGHSIQCEKQVKELEDDLKLNATMLAKQTDLAREAEIRVKELEARNKELVEGIEKHYRGNKISCVESDGSISTVKCRGLEELYKLVEKESK